MCSEKDRRQMAAANEAHLMVAGFIKEWAESIQLALSEHQTKCGELKRPVAPAVGLSLLSAQAILSQVDYLERGLFSMKAKLEENGEGRAHV